jgi:hypothetical protein
MEKAKGFAAGSKEFCRTCYFMFTALGFLFIWIDFYSTATKTVSPILYIIVATILGAGALIYSGFEFAEKMPRVKNQKRRGRKQTTLDVFLR